MISVRAPLVSLALALSGIPAFGPTADARTVYDGAWSVTIFTNQGPCDHAYRYGVQILDGNVVSDGASGATMQGRVTPRGALRVTVQAGSQWADGSGRLTKTQGSGVWKGQGTSGTCTGIWQAERMPG